jgi:endo-1,4-beta-xylanase
VENWWGRELGTVLGISYTDKNKTGSVTIDGDTYTIYENLITGKPPNNRIQTYKQYMVVRANKRTEGIVSVNEHFKAWENLGMELGKIFEVSLAVSGIQSLGTAEVRRNVLTIGGDSIGNTH